MPETLRVRFSDACTDVLVWLADQPASNWWTPHHIAESAAPSDADDAFRSCQGAIGTLFGCGLVEGCKVEGMPMFRATDEGRRAVAEARQNCASPTDGAA